MTAPFAVPMSSEGGNDTATSGVYRGNATAATAQSGGGISVQITGVKSSSSGIVTMSIPPGTYAALIDIYDMGGNLVDNWMISPDTSNIGTLFVDNYAYGRYTLMVHVPSSLKQKIVATFDPNGSTTISPTYHFGDLDGDNVVSQDEIDFIRYHLGANANAAESYFPDFSGPYAGRYAIRDADFDHDGVITQADLDLATPNVGLHGDSL